MKDIPGSWRKYRALGTGERRVLHRAVILLPLARAGIGLLGFRRCWSLAARIGTRPDHGLPAGPAEGLSAPATARMVSIAAHRGPCPASCLPRSLVLWYLLRRAGFEAALRIGARTRAGRFQAHAWVEAGGRRLDPIADIDEFTPFSELSPS